MHTRELLDDNYLVAMQKIGEGHAYINYRFWDSPKPLAEVPNVVWVECNVLKYDSEDNTYLVEPVHPDIKTQVFDNFWTVPSYLRPISRPPVIRKPDGMFCIECKNFSPMAEPNFEDKLVCWSCCDSLGWKYSKDKKTGKVTAK